MNNDEDKNQKNLKILEENIPINEYVFNPKHKIKDLAKILKVSNFFLIKKFIDLGMKINVNQYINKEIINLLANHFNIKVVFETKKKPNNNNQNKCFEEEKIIKRSPIVTIMGHVDHGKTTLLDAIIKKRTVEKEFGGITQHIRAYEIICDNNEKITFIDSPGHEAFFQMRSRGAKVTDFCLLVVAADDGVKEQTIESIKHAQEAQVDIIVAINKIDKPNNNKENIMSELSKFGLVPEKWGGKTVYVEISALKNQGIDELLSIIILMRDIKDIKTDLNKLPKGVVLEASLDKNKGPVATIISFQGIVKIGDFIVIEDFFGKIRSIECESYKKIKKAFPSQPILISGLPKIPEAGANFVVCENIKEAKKISEENKNILLKKNQKEENLDDMIEENVFDIDNKKIENFFNIILKTDQQGSIEAILKSLEQIKIKNDNVKIKIVKSSVGMITMNDIKLAQTFNAFLIGFNIFINSEIQKTAYNYKIKMKNYNVLYEITDDIEKQIKDMEEPIFEDKLLGKAEIRKIFNISSIGVIAGCYVIEGEILNNTVAKIIRNNKLIAEDKIVSLKHLKNNISKANKGHECGILLEKFNSFQLEDIIESYKKEKVKDDFE